MRTELDRALEQALDWHIAQIMQTRQHEPQAARITRLEAARAQFAQAGLKCTRFADLPPWIREIMLTSGAWPPQPS